MKETLGGLVYRKRARAFILSDRCDEAAWIGDDDPNPIACVSAFTLAELLSELHVETADDVRAAAASCCEYLADLMANGAGGTAEERLRQAARMIRQCDDRRSDSPSPADKVESKP
jgi:hypothetical protein